jgi:demethylmenaquinone methyltransferase/2-methoxy-6-polyprenyl-1,4-benzoquinol methylase
MSQISTETLSNRYDNAAPKWTDKMRALGYYDGYLGFLSEPGADPVQNAVVVDVGAGTGAFAEAWVAVNGPPSRLTLLDPSRAMLSRAAQALARRGVEARTHVGLLGDFEAQADEVLAAHVIEHCPDPRLALRQLRALLRPGGRLRLVVSKPHWCNAIIWVQWRHRTFGGAEMRDLLSEAGFSVENEYRFPSGPPSRTSRGFVAVAG